MTITRSQFEENRSDLTARAEESLRAHFGLQVGLEAEVALEEAGLDSMLGGAFRNASKQNFYASGSDENFQLHQDEIALGQGQLERGQVNAQVNEARAGIEAIRTKQEKKAAQRNSDMMLMMLLDQIDAWERQAQVMEDRFSALYGDNWREDLAEDILSEVPKQRTGESLEDYRERLEKELVDEMINPVTGKLKSEYKNHLDPKMRQYALWAETRYNIRQGKQDAEILNDPNAPEEQKQKIRKKYEQPGYTERATSTSAQLEDNKKEQAKIQQADDKADDALSSEYVPENSSSAGLMSYLKK
ncbi:MAG: hypothetical protein KDI11_00880 [Alphaproteobacteria bacterium]|nr:hypothetical protein [Alphaproteobacteria bacterium]